MTKRKWGIKEWFTIALTTILLLILALISLGDDNAKHRTTENIQQETTTKLEQQLKLLQQENKQLKISKKEATKVVSQKPRQQVVASKPQGCEQYRAEVSKYDWNVNAALAIMCQESGGDPTNHNWSDRHRTCTGSFGLFNIGCGHGYSVSYLENPQNNIKVAYDIYLGQGRTFCTTGGWINSCRKLNWI